MFWYDLSNFMMIIVCEIRKETDIFNAALLFTLPLLPPIPFGFRLPKKIPGPEGYPSHTMRYPPSPTTPSVAGTPQGGWVPHGQGYP